ncbi:MAG: 1,4-dihydroxy-2-naphthoate polyprenyltransferase [Gemmatimonadota bacterium]
MAARPKTLVAAAAPVVAGTGLAAYHGRMALLPALAALVGALLIQIATNLANDYYDFVRGGDTHERVGPVRVTQAGILVPQTVRRGMVVVLALAALVGAYLVWVGGWPILVIGLVSLALAVLYTGGPYPLAYHGLGDLFVFIFFGLGAVAGTYYVQALDWSLDAFLVGAGMGAMNTAILVVNNLRDLETDAAAGKRTLAVRLGRGGTRAEYVLLLVLAAAIPVVGVAVLSWPAAALVALAPFLTSVRPLRTVLTYTHPRELLPALGQTARLVALYGAALALGFAWG